MGSERRRKPHMRYERRIFALALATGVPAAVLALRLLNRGGAALLGRPAEQLLGKDAAELGLADTLAGDAPRVLEIAFPGRAGQGRWEVRRGTFRQRGLPHQLLVLADVSRALSDEERQAGQRRSRVLS